MTDTTPQAADTEYDVPEAATPETFDPEAKASGVHLFGITNEAEGYTIDGGVGANTKLVVDGVRINGSPFGCDEYAEIEAHDYDIIGTDTGERTIFNIKIRE